MKRKGFFQQNYSMCWKFFRESRWHIVASLAIFAFFFLFGFVLPIFFREKIFEFMASLVGSLDGLNTIEIIGFILFNNIKASLFALVLGIGFGIFPIITGVVNGYLLGFVAREAAGIEGISVLWRLAPHGIFELPAVLFSIGMGMKVGFTLFSTKKKNDFKRNIKESLRFFLFVVIPLLIIAAIIEGILVSLSM